MQFRFTHPYNSGLERESNQDVYQHVLLRISFVALCTDTHIRVKCAASGNFRKWEKENKGAIHHLIREILKFQSRSYKVQI